MVAAMPGLMGRTGALLADVLGAHFSAEDDLLASTRELAVVFKDAEESRNSMLLAAQRSRDPTISAAEQLASATKFDTFRLKAEEDRAKLKRARFVHDLATAHYNSLLDGLLNDPVYV